jgi:hypothetical protein
MPQFFVPKIRFLQLRDSVLHVCSFLEATFLFLSEENLMSGDDLNH